MDLVGPGALEPHFEDSMAAVSDLNAAGSWVDLGAGAGFPGLVFAALNPQANIVLVESRQKRAVFLSQAIRATKLKNVSLFHGRTEAITQTFDGIISRAYKPPLEYLKDARRLSTPSSLAVLLLSSTQETPQSPGWRIVSEKEYSTETSARKRVILTPEGSATC